MTLTAEMERQDHFWTNIRIILCMICCSFGCYAQFVLKFPKDRLWERQYACELYCFLIIFAGSNIHWCLRGRLLPFLWPSCLHWHVCQCLVISSFAAKGEMPSSGNQDVRHLHKSLELKGIIKNQDVAFWLRMGNVQGIWADCLRWCDNAAVLTGHGDWP